VIPPIFDASPDRKSFINLNPALIMSGVLVTIKLRKESTNTPIANARLGALAMTNWMIISSIFPKAVRTFGANTVS
jgi:hypothetical protein